VAETIQVANEAPEMAEIIINLLRDPERARTLGLAGRRQVTAEYNWQEALDKLVRLVENPFESGFARI
jgi:glycosyltransferase involved in cell wall biosynthesis